RENMVLRQMVKRLSADTRIAEVLVTGVNYDELSGKTNTTIKFLEYSVTGEPLEPRYFTFSGNLIQFQSLVVRFRDEHVERADRFRGKSVYLFWKVFVLDGPRTTEHIITAINSVPEGYAVPYGGGLEKTIWENFWKYALSPEGREKAGIKNAQIEAPGTVFVPGILYTLKIEHDGGIRIDTSPLSPIVQGETIPRRASS
ncbi:MAG TPA: hypothetical protein PKZ41_01800, partial [Candidatus Omnitrophota bacterium]|nr:hypothetical protein [Candidatus Omnitrophota bacterium]